MEGKKEYIAFLSPLYLPEEVIKEIDRIEEEQKESHFFGLKKKVKILLEPFKIDEFLNQITKDLTTFFGLFGKPALVLYPFNSADKSKKIARKLCEDFPSQEALIEKWLKENRLKEKREESENTSIQVAVVDFDFYGKEVPTVNFLTQLHEIAVLNKKYKGLIKPIACVDSRRYHGEALSSFKKEYAGLGFENILEFHEPIKIEGYEVAETGDRLGIRLSLSLEST